MKSIKETPNQKLKHWLLGAIFLVAILLLIIIRPLPFLFCPNLPYLGFLSRAIYILILSAGLSLYRICRGPTGAALARARRGVSPGWEL